MSGREIQGIASYNIKEGPIYTELIGENLARLAAESNIKVFCLQECSSIEGQKLQRYLPEWNMYYFQQDPNKPKNGLAFVIAPDSMLINMQQIITGSLPSSRKFIIPPFRDDITPKGFMSTTFEINPEYFPQRTQIDNGLILPQTLCLTTVHLNLMQTPSHRLKQLQFVMSNVNKNADISLILGDFNKFDLISNRKIHEYMAEEQGYYELLRGTTHTAKLTQSPNPYNRLESRVMKGLERMGIPLHQKLDGAFISIKEGTNIAVADLVLYDMLGSDHFPYIIYIGA